MVFHGVDELHATIDDPALDIQPDDVLVLQNGGPVGAPGMPEYGHLPMPSYLLRQGVTDMVRISDARMSGTGFGTVVLHVTPESAIGGPLALIRTGDRIRLDTAGRRLDVLVGDEELAERRRAWVPGRRTTRVAIGVCTCGRSCRPTKAATWTSSSGGQRRYGPGSRTGERPRRRVVRCASPAPPERAALALGGRVGGGEGVDQGHREQPPVRRARRGPPGAG